VGIFGLTTCRTPVLDGPDKSLVFLNEIDSARKTVAALRMNENVDVVVALTHMGDRKEAPNHVTSLELAQAVDGINVIIDGHSHTLFDKPKVINNTWIVSAGSMGKYMGEGILTLDNNKPVSFDWKAVKLDNKVYPPDNAVNAMLAYYRDWADQTFKQVIGTAAGDFPFGKEATRYGETALGDGICDLMANYAADVYGVKPDFVILNGGGIRAELKAGPITQEAVQTILPFKNYLWGGTLTGQQVEDLFRFVASIPQGAGGFAQVSSDVRYTVDYSAGGATGSGELKDLSIHGQPVDPNKTYIVVTNDYMMRGGDGYKVMAEAQNKVNSQLLMSYVVGEEIKRLTKANVAIAPYTDGRITVIGGKQP
jgi:5'-nucleotidase/UDP-sugar diphosphatase